MGIQQDGYAGQMDPTVPTHPFNAIKFLVSQVCNANWTLTLCRVKAVKGGGIDAPPLVDVQPLVNEVDGYGNQTPHGTIFGLPVFRLQGGSSAIVADPAVDDIGILACASRDISSVIKNRAPSNPGSRRTFDPSDGMYLGGLLGNAPTQYVQITPDGINIVFPGDISIKLSSNGITLTVGAHSIVVSSAGIMLNGIDWATHTHAVTTAPGETGPPV